MPASLVAPPMPNLCAASQVQTEISGAQERVNCATADARPSADAASRARAELLAFRRETFDSLSVAPPQYEPDNAHDDSSSLPNTP